MYEPLGINLTLFNLTQPNTMKDGYTNFQNKQVTNNTHENKKKNTLGCREKESITKGLCNVSSVRHQQYSWLLRNKLCHISHCV